VTDNNQHISAPQWTLDLAAKWRATADRMRKTGSHATAKKLDAMADELLAAAKGQVTP
jgi:hypothetical protein